MQVLWHKCETDHSNMPFFYNFLQLATNIFDRHRSLKSQDSKQETSEIILILKKRNVMNTMSNEMIELPRCKDTFPNHALILAVNLSVSNLRRYSPSSCGGSSEGISSSTEASVVGEETSSGCSSAGASSICGSLDSGTGDDVEPPMEPPFDCDPRDSPSELPPSL